MMMKDPDIISDTRETNHFQQQHSTEKDKKIMKQIANHSSNANSLLIPIKTEVNNDVKLYANRNVHVLKCNNQIKELHTVLRDKETSHSDFKFYSDRLIRLLVEEGLNELPYSTCDVITPAGCTYHGVKYIKGVCGVSIMRSGEAMEKGLRECCRSIRIGKILIQSTDEDRKSSVVYAKFPSDINSRKILLMYPITTTGTTVNLAISVLKEHGVFENNILLLCLFSTPNGLQSVNAQYPDVHILTSEINQIAPNDFGQRYFGTE